MWDLNGMILSAYWDIDSEWGLDFGRMKCVMSFEFWNILESRDL